MKTNHDRVYYYFSKKLSQWQYFIIYLQTKQNDAAHELKTNPTLNKYVFKKYPNKYIYKISMTIK